MAELDLVVIGAGPGGYVAAVRAADGFVIDQIRIPADVVDAALNDLGTISLPD